MTPPNCARFNWSREAAKKFRALKTALRTNPKPSPWSWFVPDFVMMFTTPPAFCPYSAL